MTTTIVWLSLLVSIIFTGFIIHFIRKQVLKEQYAILWLILSGMMIFFSLFPVTLDRLAMMLNVSYAPSLLYFLGFIGTLCILLHLTIAVSMLSERTVTLAQKLAIHEEQLQQNIRNSNNYGQMEGE
ncbi:MAG TPA: DUF2304 domain-containing protein [Candidatus Paenibacillus intestinavium]|nr:DUF2304 domain-containing protein [Candidatus Paenibacillus intestinavium]